MKGRIALVQFHSTNDDRINLKRMVGFVKRERGRSDLIVFPELAIKRAFSAVEEKELLKGFGKLAKKNRIDLVPGSVLVRSKGKSYNRSYYIDKSGRVLAKYDKNSPWKSEGITRGNGPKAFKTSFGRTTLIICWDLASPVVASKLAKLNLDLIICPSLWWKGSESGFGADFTGEMIDSFCLALAYACRAAVAYANAAGKLRLSHFSDWSAGHSQVVAPFRNRICKTKRREESVIRCVLDSTLLVLARRYFG